MENHQFGSDWTEKKLNCVKEYSLVWSRIMKNQGYWRTRYIDAFSGTGTFQHSSKNDLQNITFLDDLVDTPDEKNSLQKGSASIALSIEPKFDRIDLIELKRSHANSLRELAGNEINKRVFVHEKDANEGLISLCSSLNKKKERALIFIDPYGCSVEWETLEAISSSQVADVWYLAPTSGINRQLSRNADQIEGYKKQRLDLVLGDRSWETEFYKTEYQESLFGPQEKNFSRRRRGKG